MQLLYLLWVVLAAVAGGWAGVRLRLPAGAMVGSMVAVAVYTLCGGPVFFPAETKIMLQIASGALIGGRLGREDFAKLKPLLPPTLYLLGSMVVLNLVFGGLAYLFTPLDAATALFAVTPGGMADMALIAEDLGADTFYVAILQLYRVLVILICLPPVFKHLIQAAPGGAKAQPTRAAPSRPGKLVQVLVAAAAGGLVFHFAGVIAGALTGGMVAAMAFCYKKGAAIFPQGYKNTLQVLTGAFVGIGINRASLQALPKLVVPALIMLVGIVCFVMGIAFTMHKLFRLDLAVCLLASTPGGIQEMALLSEDLGADTPKIAVMQTIRMFFVILCFPTMLRAILALLAL